MQIIKNTKIDVNDNLREVVESAGPGDRILVADLPKDEVIRHFIITNLGAYIVTDIGSLYHNNVKIDFPIDMTQYNYWKNRIFVYEKNFVFRAYDERFASFDFQPAQKIKKGVEVKEYSKKVDEIALRKKCNVPENMSLENSFDTEYGTVLFEEYPYGKISFLDKEGKEIQLNNEFVHKGLHARKDGIVMSKRENLCQGTSTSYFFFLYDEILSGGRFYEWDLPENFSDGLSLKDIVFLNNRGEMKIDRKRENQLWFVMRDKIE